jgi:hypothetical protein
VSLDKEWSSKKKLGPRIRNWVMGQGIGSWDKELGHGIRNWVMGQGIGSWDKELGH